MGGLPIKLRAFYRRPAAISPDAIAHPLVGGPELIARLLVCHCNITRRMHADRLRWPLKLLVGAEMQIDVGQEPLRIAADDGKHQREVVACRADYGFRASADTDPRLKRAMLDRREDQLVAQRRAHLAL